VLLRILVFRDVTLGPENRGTRSLQNFGNHSNKRPGVSIYGIYKVVQI